MYRRSLVAFAFSALTVVFSVSLAGAPQATTPAASTGQATPPQPAGGNSDIYRVSMFRAAPGKTGDLEKLLTTQAPSPGAGDGDFAVIFRHRQGNEWDFLTVEHMGQQATVDVRTGPPAQPDSPFSQSAAWHMDTFAAGPSLDEFRKALNLQAGAAQSGSAKPGDTSSATTWRRHGFGIYIGGGRFIHAPHSGDVVRISPLGRLVRRDLRWRKPRRPERPRSRGAEVVHQSRGDAAVRRVGRVLLHLPPLRLGVRILLQPVGQLTEMEADLGGVGQPAGRVGRARRTLRWDHPWSTPAPPRPPGARRPWGRARAPFVHPRWPRRGPFR